MKIGNKILRDEGRRYLARVNTHQFITDHLLPFVTTIDGLSMPHYKGHILWSNLHNNITRNLFRIRDF